MSEITLSDLRKLTEWDTPTICNGLEVVIPERRTIGFTTMPLVALDPSLPPICGYARTATMRAVTPPQGDAKATRAAYYTYVADGALPRIVVLQDLDPEPGFGAFWGEVNTNIHKGLGCLGCVTNGSFRDVDASAPGFQILGGKVGPSHGWVHPVDFGVPVNVGGMAVNHDDIIHADRHGAVVVPAEAVKKLPDAIALLERREKVILDAAKSPDFDIDKLKAAMAGSAEIH